MNEKSNDLQMQLDRCQPHTCTMVMSGLAATLGSKGASVMRWVTRSLM